MAIHDDNWTQEFRTPTDTTHVARTWLWFLGVIVFVVLAVGFVFQTGIG
jgi:hypothetical protein